MATQNLFLICDNYICQCKLFIAEKENGYRVVCKQEGRGKFKANMIAGKVLSHLNQVLKYPVFHLYIDKLFFGLSHGFVLCRVFNFENISLLEIKKGKD